MSTQLEISSPVSSEQPAQLDYSDIGEIERVHHSSLSYDAFFHRYMRRNRAVIITGLPETWDCYRNWTTSADGQLNIAYLSEKMNTLPVPEVPVADCGGEMQYNAHRKLQMSIAEFLNYWQLRLEDEHSEQRVLYLKDWHLRQTMPEYCFYRTPEYFASDWLNEKLVASGEDDYRFVYIGPKGTWTPFHADVFGSFSWSTNISGHKRWLLLPPGEQLKLLDAFGQPPQRIDEPLLTAQHVRYFAIDQLAGETIFVPSDWWHQVLNVTSAVSVNHNWFNGCNVWHIWSTLLAEYGKVCTEIADCRDMQDFRGHCQLMLGASHGMHFAGLLAILQFVAGRRLAQLRRRSGDEAIGCDGYELGAEHCRFDLREVERVAMDMGEQVGDEYAEIRAECERLFGLIEEGIA